METIVYDMSGTGEFEASKPVSRFRIEQKVMREIYKTLKAEANVSHIYKETLAEMINLFSRYIYENSQNESMTIPCWHASAERAIAKIRQDANIKLPVITVSRIQTVNSENRRRYSSLLVNEKWWDHDKQRAVRVVSLPPVPVDIIYRVNIWSKYNENMDQIVEQVRRTFNPDVEIYTEHNQSTKAYIVDEEDLSEAIVGDGSDRVIRKSFNIQVESYIPSLKFLMTSTGKIETFNIEAYTRIA